MIDEDNYFSISTHLESGRVLSFQSVVGGFIGKYHWDPVFVSQPIIDVPDAQEYLRTIIGTNCPLNNNVGRGTPPNQVALPDVDAGL